jgi:RNA 3'-terminal phosphate cyclase (ATP)
MLTIDGSMGEGGGQVLRTSLALSILTRQPIQLANIRAGREKPGLQPQHLQAVQAAAAICDAQVEGAALRSRALTFTPGEIRGARYQFNIGTAGSTSLVLQTIFLPLARAGGSSQVTITGGTHVPHSPCYDYLERQWLPVMQALGFRARLSMLHAGFYPQGGGQIIAQIRPAGEIQPMQRIERGQLVRIRGLSAVANLDSDIARRQKLQALRRLEPICRDSKIETSELDSPGKGTVLLVHADCEHASATYFALGALGKRAEHVADEAVEDLLAFLETGAAVDQYLADQLVLPLAFASGPSRYRTSNVTRHLLTQAALVPMFLPVEVRVEGEEDRPGTVDILPQ